MTEPKTLQEWETEYAKWKSSLEWYDQIAKHSVGKYDYALKCATLMERARSAIRDYEAQGVRGYSGYDPGVA